MNIKNKRGPNMEPWTVQISHSTAVQTSHIGISDDLEVALMDFVDSSDILVHLEWCYQIHIYGTMNYVVPQIVVITRPTDYGLSPSMRYQLYHDTRSYAFFMVFHVRWIFLTKSPNTTQVTCDEGWIRRNLTWKTIKKCMFSHTLYFTL